MTAARSAGCPPGLTASCLGAARLARQLLWCGIPHSGFSCQRCILFQCIKKSPSVYGSSLYTMVRKLEHRSLHHGNHLTSRQRSEYPDGL